MKTNWQEEAVVHRRVAQQRTKECLQLRIMLAWEAGFLSEGQACKRLGMDRIEARIWKHDLINNAMKGGEV